MKNLISILMLSLCFLCFGFSTAYASNETPECESGESLTGETRYHAHCYTDTDTDTNTQLNKIQAGVGLDVGVNQILEKIQNVAILGKVLKPKSFLEHVNISIRKDMIDLERGEIWLVLDLTELKKKAE